MSLLVHLTSITFKTKIKIGKICNMKNKCFTLGFQKTFSVSVCETERESVSVCVCVRQRESVSVCETERESVSVCV